MKTRWLKAVKRYAITYAWLIAIALVDGACLMFAVAIVHVHWIPAVPRIGYLYAASLMILLRAMYLSFTDKRLRKL